MSEHNILEVDKEQSNRTYTAYGDLSNHNGNSVARLDAAPNEEDDLDEESVSLANELLPEYYDIGGSVHSQENCPMESINDTRLIVRDLIDRVERLTRENSILKQVAGRRDQVDLEDEYFHQSPSTKVSLTRKPLWPDKRYGDYSRSTFNHFDSSNGDTLFSNSKSFGSSGASKLAPTKYREPPSKPYESSIIPQHKVTFSEFKSDDPFEVAMATQNDMFRERILDAIHRHRECVDALRDVISSDMVHDPYEPNTPFASIRSNSQKGPGMFRWRLENTLLNQKYIPQRINLRKPIWFRDLRYND